MQPWTINSEIGTLDGELPCGRAPLEEAWLKTRLGIDVTLPKLTRLRRLDGPDEMPELHAMATKAAERRSSWNILYGFDHGSIEGRNSAVHSAVVSASAFRGKDRRAFAASPVGSRAKSTAKAAALRIPRSP